MAYLVECQRNIDGARSTLEIRLLGFLISIDIYIFWILSMLAVYEFFIMDI